MISMFTFLFDIQRRLDRLERLLREEQAREAKRQAQIDQALVLLNQILVLVTPPRVARIELTLGKPIPQ